jgi:hypothetical protein
VRAGGVELGQYCCACALTGLDRGAHASATGTDDDDVVLMDLHTLALFLSKFAIKQRAGVACTAKHSPRLTVGNGV